MKKQLVIIGIVVLFICIGLSGCTNDDNSQDVADTSNDLAKFVGTWKLDKNDRNWTITFFSNGTCSGTITGNRYEIKDGKLVCSQESGLGTGYTSYDYYFSENDTKLHLKYAETSGYFSVYLKQ